MRDNTITAYAGDKLYIKTDSVFQYDYGLKLIIDGVTLPEEYDVHFCNTNSKKTKTVTGDATGVLIPDEYIRNGEDIHAYVYLHTDEDDGESVYHIQIPVIERAAVGEEEITPIEHGVIEKALEALAEAVELTDANVEHYPYINEDEYWMVYDASREEFVNTGVKASGDNTYDLDIGTVVTLPPGAQATASMTWEDGNARLNLGIPAGDASDAVTIHDERINLDTVQIKDGANNVALDDIMIRINPRQDGSGNPSPQNIRRISGWTVINIFHIGGGTSNNYQVLMDDDPGMIYGGYFYPLTGELIIDRVLVTKRCVDMNNMEVQPGWKNAGIRSIVGENVAEKFTGQTLNIGTSYGVDTTGDNDLLYLPYDSYGMRQTDWINTEITVQICLYLGEPITYHFTPIPMVTKLGNNSYYSNAGKIAYFKYPCDTKLYIDAKIAELQALVLEN